MATKMTYQQYRAQNWAHQGGAEPWSFRNGTTKDGSGLTYTILQPRRNLFFKDLWIAPNIDHARECALTVLEFPQVNYLQWDGKFVYVQFREDDADWELDGQELDDREIYKST